MLGFFKKLPRSRSKIKPYKAIFHWWRRLPMRYFLKKIAWNNLFYYSLIISDLNLGSLEGGVLQEKFATIFFDYKILGEIQLVIRGL
jgi:hypothetical protein